VRLCRDGREVEVAVTVSPIRDASGRIVGASSIARDIGERRRAEREREELIAELRRYAVTQQAVAQQRDEFLAMLGHELRNPIAAIKHASEIAGGLRHEDPRVARYIGIVARQSAKLGHIVDGLLDLSRISHGFIELQRVRTDLALVTREALERTRPFIQARRHELQVVIDGAPLDADPTRLEQVIANLLDNAATYTKPGGHIWLTAGREGEAAVIRVRDDGVGIDGDLLGRLFEPFTQADRTLARSEGGLGIGLALTRSLVRMHGGTVEARSDGLGRGSEFVVRLPLADDGAPLSAPAVRPRRAPAHLRVLVVDDNVDLADTLADAVASWGHTVTVAHDGTSALAAALAAPPAVVLLDIGLPDLDGYEVARRLRPQLPEARLIAVTGYGQPQDRERALAAGFDHHLVKPVDLDNLQCVVEEPIH
jgi:signal transduction histidine kinase/CheY-like chemotaxis protein